MTDNISRAAVEAVVRKQFEVATGPLNEAGGDIADGMVAALDALRQCVLVDIRSLPPAPVEGEGLDLARECFLDMLADARRWDVDYDGDEVNGRAVSYVTHFIEVGDFAFDPLAEALGIKQTYMQTMEDAIRCAIDEPPAAVSPPIPHRRGRSMSDWQSIESAPKDDGGGRGTGPTILLYYPPPQPSSVEQVCLGHWLDNTRFDPPWEGFRPLIRGSVPWGKPTHWMPLPSPPTALSQTPGGED